MIFYKTQSKLKNLKHIKVMKINYLLLIILINTSIVIGQGTQALSPTKNQS